jgi:hypothetical protein
LKVSDGWVSVSPFPGLQIGKRPFCLRRGRWDSRLSKESIERQGCARRRHSPANRGITGFDPSETFKLAKVKDRFVSQASIAEEARCAKAGK